MHQTTKHFQVKWTRFTVENASETKTRAESVSAETALAFRWGGRPLFVRLQLSFPVQDAGDLADLILVAPDDDHRAAADHAFRISVGVRARKATILQNRDEVVGGGPDVDVGFLDSSVLQ